MNDDIITELNIIMEKLEALTRLIAAYGYSDDSEQTKQNVLTMSGDVLIDMIANAKTLINQ